jgi:DNA primase
MRKLSSEQRLSLEQRTLAYQEGLLSPDGSDLRDYLEEGRGLTPATIAKFRLGYVESPGESDDLARGMISIPYISPTGVVALRFRRPPHKETGPKYWQPEGTKLGIFNTPVIAAGGREIFTVEGEFDCMIGDQLGLPIVGFPGTGSWKPHYRAVFEGYDKVIALGDNDDKGAGAKFVEKVAGQVPNPVVRMMPEGHDLNSFFLAEGADAVLEYLGVAGKEYQ